ncbi:conserved hypothetical protein [Verticillium alfalfae VaMs.102]|uniref:Uncharacterized protein n=1 Tax=Verticillium alfalfae (strain VaMs.102 / ATCC MYA-4576 / FGSC 10136) TaxID=526221 RepID=C9SXH7_VERA1|nr:conserved hypothetical protein [Verticillium alfalfae VaMs.102]EEY23367.1 conserved hypothetical protein [Verticillium alfalfae VaMs.102]
MSWMDSWSRPSKSQATPAPFYLLPHGDATPYCRTCGRVISSRKSAAAATKKPDARKTDAPKYCSSRCRGHKPGRLDREIEAAFVRFLQRDEALAETGAPRKATKGDARLLGAVRCRREPRLRQQGGSRKVFARDRRRGCASATRVIPGEAIIDEMLGLARTKSAEVDPSVQASLSVRSGTRVRPPQTRSQVNGSVGGEKGKAERVEETEEMREKRNEGQKRAHERELVRCAARRGVVFGFAVDGQEERRKCEAIMQGKVVEPSFAKGDWAVRWREE